LTQEKLCEQGTKVERKIVSLSQRKETTTPHNEDNAVHGKFKSESGEQRALRNDIGAGGGIEETEELS